MRRGTGKETDEKKLRLVRKRMRGREESVSHCLTVGCKKSASHVKIPSVRTQTHTHMLQQYLAQHTRVHTHIKMTYVKE